MKKNWMFYCLGFLLVYVLWLFKGDEFLGLDREMKDPIAGDALLKSDSSQARIAMHFTGLLIQ